MAKAPGGFVVQAGIVCLLVLALRLPFLDHAVQGDDFYYLKAAEHAQIDPWHPNHARYVFLREMVDMRGHPHPPLNSWFLAGLLALTGDEREVPYHAAYLLWSLMAALGALALARRFVPQRALAATALFCSTLPFVINGTSLESDLPLLGSWMCAAALFVAATDRGSAVLAMLSFLFGALAGLAAYQAVLLFPVLGVYLWGHRRAWIPGWLALCGAPAAILGYQLFERSASGAVPAGMLADYLGTHGFQALSAKLRSAAALTGHLGWIVFPAAAFAAFRHVRRAGAAAVLGAALLAAVLDPHPLFWISVAAGVLIAVWCGTRLRNPDRDTRFLCAWTLLFFAAALILFFAGSARYLLPLSAPVAILAARELRERWLYSAAAANAVLGLLLAAVNSTHWDGYRRIAAGLRDQTASHRVWVNGEWGLRHYLEAEGALPLEHGRPPRDNDLVVSTAYAGPVEAPLARIATYEIHSPIPLRLVGTAARSGYSSIAFGLRPFDISRSPLDVVRVDAVRERKATLGRVATGTPEAGTHIVSGVFNHDRWMSGQAVLLLKRNPGANRVSAVLYLPPASPARTFALAVDGSILARETFPGPGQYTLSAAVPASTANSATVVITADKTFTAPPDARPLSALLLEAGFE